MNRLGLVAAAGLVLVGCGSGPSTVDLKYLDPMARVVGPLYIQVSGSSGLVNAIRRTATHAGLKKFHGFTVGVTVVPTVRGSKDCSRTIRYSYNRADPLTLKQFAGQPVRLTMFGGHRGGGPLPLFCQMPGLMVQFILSE